MRQRLSLGRALFLLPGLVALAGMLAGAPGASASDPSISAAPPTVTLPAGQTFAPVTITWTTGDKGNGWQVWRISPAPASDPATCPSKASTEAAQIGSMGFPVVNTTNMNKTSAYAGDNVFLLCDQKGNVLATVHVTGQATATGSAAATTSSISADPNPATIPDGELTAQVTLTWDPAGATSWYVSGPDSYGRPSQVAKCGFLATCSPPFSQSVAVVAGDNPFALINSDTTKTLGSVSVHAAYQGGSTQGPYIKADPLSVPIPSGQQAAQANLTCYTGGGSNAGQIWYSRPGGAGQPSNTGQITTKGDTKDTCAGPVKVDVFLGDNAFTLWDATMQQQLATVHVQGQVAQCSSPCVLKPTRVVADTAWQGDGDSACGEKPTGPSPSSGALSSPVDQAGGDVGGAGYSVGQAGLVCWAYQNSSYIVGVGFDMSAIAQFVASHGLKNGIMRYGVQGDSCFTSDSIVVSGESTMWNSFPATYGILEVIPTGSSVATASQLPAVGAGTTATGPHGEHLLGGDPTSNPTQVDVGYWLTHPISDSEHFVLTGSAGPTDSGVWGCDETVTGFSLTLTGDH